MLVGGGGVAALETVLALHRLAGERLEIELVAREASFVYRALSVGEPFGLTETPHYDLAGLAREIGVRFRRDAIERVDAGAHRVVTREGATLVYDDLVLALGARPEPAVRGALTFGGPDDVEALAAALRGLGGPSRRRVTFVVPEDVGWTLPLYELALLTVDWARREGRSLEVTVVTRERSPLGVFGAEGGHEVERLLDERGIDVRAGSFAEELEGDRLYLELEGPLSVDLAVALPRLIGPGVDGLPHDEDGFVEVDERGRVGAAPDVYAAGDMTTRPLKQGGLAAQQADVVAAEIAAQAGADVELVAYRPVLRGLLLSGEAPRYLRREAGESSEPSSLEPLWWPAHKVAGRHLAPFLAAHPELAVQPATAAPPDRSAGDYGETTVPAPDEGAGARA